MKNASAGSLPAAPSMCSTRLSIPSSRAHDRLLRPHAFYQVHRITGKTVSTASHEAVVCSTKVLEIGRAHV